MNNVKSFAIVVVCYNRIDGLIQLTDSLLRANYCGRNDITLIFSIDNSGSSLVEDYAKNFEWCHGQKIIRTFPTRQGLKQHILQCGEYTDKYDVVVVLEDDIIVSDSFYSYAYNAALFYWDNENIAGISLYTFQKNWLKWVLRFEPMKKQYDCFFVKVAQSWGQVWTRDKWKPFQNWLNDNPVFDKNKDHPQYLNAWPESSWLKFHDQYCIDTNKYFVYPYYSLSTNTSAAGEHSNMGCNDYQTDLQFEKTEFNFQPFSSESIIYDEYLERVGLGKYLQLPEEEIFIDFYGTRKIDNSRKYVLTTRRLKDVMPEKGYKLSLRPIEASVIYGIEGEGIYLYKTTDYLKRSKTSVPFELMKYEMRTHDWSTLLPFSLKLLLENGRTKMRRLLRKYVGIGKYE